MIATNPTINDIDKIQVILVNEDDSEIGLASKLFAHENGMLHRAFSVFLFNSKGEFLLQRRAFEKYHCGGLWSNSCCGHPLPGETIEMAAKKRVFEELGLTCDVHKIGVVRYMAILKNGLIENEIDHLFVGQSEGIVSPDPKEVEGWRYESAESLQAEINEHSEHFTPWFNLLLPDVLKWRSLSGGVQK